MKRALIILLVIITIVAVGGYFLFIKAITPGDLPAKVKNAEEAIATSGTIGIASVDMTYIRRIDEMFNPEKDPSPLSVAKPAESEEEKSFLKKLKQQGVDLISLTDHALATIDVSQKKPTYSFVLFGRFSGVKLKQVLGQHYLID
ncbi:MAG: hypothetical protein OEW99_14340, partial [Gammaproteobacteria bacterium]|nr:hypothetical protein [Gammaproteobacteria bacterium]